MCKAERWVGMVDGISIREAASELGVSVQTVHNRIKSGATAKKRIPAGG